MAKNGFNPVGLLMAVVAVQFVERCAYWTPRLCL